MFTEAGSVAQHRIRSCAVPRRGKYSSPDWRNGGVNRGLRYSLLALCQSVLCQCVPELPSAGPDTVASRPAEIPPSGLPQSDRRSPRKARWGEEKNRVRMLATRVRSPTT